MKQSFAVVSATCLVAFCSCISTAARQAYNARLSEIDVAYEEIRAAIAESYQAHKAKALKIQTRKVDDEKRSDGTPTEIFWAADDKWLEDHSASPSEWIELATLSHNSRIDGYVRQRIETLRAQKRATLLNLKAVKAKLEKLAADERDWEIARRQRSLAGFFLGATSSSRQLDISQSLGKKPRSNGICALDTECEIGYVCRGRPATQQALCTEATAAADVQEADLPEMGSPHVPSPPQL